MKDVARFFRSSVIAFILMVGMVCIIGTGGGGGGGDGDGTTNTVKTYTASGTYSYDADMKVLTATFTSSEFPDCGPGVGIDTYWVESITATTMLLPGEQMLWQRDSGTPDDITGTWDWTDEDGNAYEININGDGSMLVIGEIIACDGLGDFPGNTSGSWNIVISIDLASLNTNFNCVPGDAPGDDTRIDNGTIVPNGGTFTLTLEDMVIFGDIIGEVYSISFVWTEVNGYMMSMVGSFTIPYPNSLMGNFTITASNSEGDFCQWNETWNGTKQ